MGKKCYACGLEKPATEFGRHQSRKDGLQVKCKACTRANSKAHYLANTASYKHRVRKHKEELERVLLDLKSGPCMDCQRSFPPCAMDFDHRDPKLKESGIRDLIKNRVSVEHLLREVAKCDLVCACCHRIRTHITRPAAQEGSFSGIVQRQDTGL